MGRLKAGVYGVGRPRRLAENDVTEYMARGAMRDDAPLLRVFKASGTVYRFLYHNRKQ